MSSPCAYILVWQKEPAARPRVVELAKLRQVLGERFQIVVKD
jgi:hypothetical protein